MDLKSSLRARAFSLFAGLILFSASALAQETENHSSVDKLFADFSKPGSPGCSLAVARGGKLLYSKAYGLANIEQNVPLTPDSVFDIGSTSKQFTAASILLLEKQGKLSLHEDIRKYIPELPDYRKKITILHLLNHTSGLRDYLTLFELAGVNTDSVTTDEEALALITRQKALNFDPGTDWLYSNTGFFLLSVIVKRASGKTLRDFAAESIFTPLQMNHTQFRDSHISLIPNRAMAYDPIEKGAGYTLNVSYFEQTGDGAVHTTVGDLLKWDENFYSGKLGGEAFLMELQAPGTLQSGKTLDYAKGLFIENHRGLRAVRHGGSWGGYRAELLRFPNQHFSVACLCNRGDGDPEKHADQVAEIYLGRLMENPVPKKDVGRREGDQPAISLAAAEMARYAGDYSSEELGVTYRLKEVGGKLQLAEILLPGGMPRSSDFAGKELLPFTANAFRLSGLQATFRFQLDSAGQPSSFILDAGRTTGLGFIRAAAGKL